MERRHRSLAGEKTSEAANVRYNEIAEFREIREE